MSQAIVSRQHLDLATWPQLDRLVDLLLVAWRSADAVGGAS